MNGPLDKIIFVLRTTQRGLIQFFLSKKTLFGYMKIDAKEPFTIIISNPETINKCILILTLLLRY